MTAADVAELSAAVAGLRAELAALAEQAAGIREAIGALTAAAALGVEEVRVIRRLGYREGLDAREDRAAAARAAERRASFTVLPGGAA